MVSSRLCRAYALRDVRPSEVLTMPDDIESLVVDLVEWVAREPRSYADVFDTWRTSCPRLPVWEEACDRGLVARRSSTSGTAIVVVTDAGQLFLQMHRRHRPAASEPTLAAE
jgi:hypothetical protein